LIVDGWLETILDAKKALVEKQAPFFTFSQALAGVLSLKDHPSLLALYSFLVLYPSV
jgi:hypothetical protein